MAIASWIKSNKFTTVLILVVVYFAYKTYFGVGPLMSVSRNSSLNMVDSSESAFDLGGSTGVSKSLGMPIVPSYGGSDASSYDGERLVVTNSSLSLLVSDVRESGSKIIEKAKSLGGFMVNASYNRPTESPFATITVRVPSEKLDSTLDYYRSIGIKVTNENLIGTDVTEQYVDIAARLETLTKTKSIFDGLLGKTENVDQILKVQRELINIQSQIDSLKGQEKALRENAAYAKLTVYLSTDELSLPYTPDNKFRPNVIFKLAVRSVMQSLYKIGEGLIWIGVYSVIWIPIVLLYKLFINWKKKKV